MLREYEVRSVIIAFGAIREPEMVPVVRACDAASVDIHVLPRFFELGATAEGREADDIWGMPIVRLPLQEIIHRAVANNLDVKVAGYQPAIDSTRSIEAEARFDPTYFANVQFERRDNTQGVPGLVKLSYVGRPSRAEFPLTREFAMRSTNSTVGLTGRATVIDDVAKHVEAGGGFYVCDDGVQSEACVPILDGARQVVGIIDAEARPKGFFGAERLAVVAALAITAAAALP